MLLFLLAVVLVLFLVQIELTRLNISRKYKHISGSKEYPIIGNIASVKRHQLSDFNLIINELCRDTVSKVTAFGQVLFVVADPAVAQTILSSSNFHKRSYIFKFFEMESALFTSIYETWKPIRKGVQSCFSKKSIVTMTNAFLKHSDNLCQELEEGFANTGAPFDIYTLIARFEINKVVETMLDCPNFNSTEYLVDTLQEASDNIGRRIFNPMIYPEIIYKFTDCRKKIRAGHDLGAVILREICGSDFTERRQRLNEINNNEQSSKIFFDELLKVVKHGKLLTYDEVVDNFKTIVVAGFETQSLAMGWILVMLAMHQDVQQKVYDEICENIPDDAELDCELLKKMEYLDMVIKETLRLFPVAPVTMRDSLQDTHVEPFGEIPKGTPVLVAIYKIHRSPEIWGPDADKFNPDNFLPSKVSERHLYSYIPYGGGGARNCIGINYATINMRIVLIKLLKKFRFTTPLTYDSIEYKYGITLKLGGGYQVIADTRKQKTS
ncbi:probable cytochrome P450 313a4 [Culicoides brevitarsis]|uniref:probable cytochrome P450 313a4 n=1 Tax=Culicoides brevitarsis TaxID=469753 RepID=UPI00307BE4AA